MADVEGYLGMILGAVVGALRETGVSEEEIHRWVDMALVSQRAVAPLADLIRREAAK